MKLNRLLSAFALGTLALSSTSCGLLLEQAAQASREAKGVESGSVIESKSFSIKVPESYLYVKRFDRSNEALILANDTLAGFEYAVFPIEANAGESPSSALIRHYARLTPLAKWQVAATRAGGAKGSVGQVDLYLPRPGGGFVTLNEFFRDGSRLWVTSQMVPRREGEVTDSDWLRRRRVDLVRFASSFRLKH